MVLTPLLNKSASTPNRLDLHPSIVMVHPVFHMNRLKEALGYYDNIISPLADTITFLVNQGRYLIVGQNAKIRGYQTRKSNGRINWRKIARGKLQTHCNKSLLLLNCKSAFIRRGVMFKHTQVHNWVKRTQVHNRGNHAVISELSA